VTGIARPQRVRAAAATLGLAIAGELAFADHHRSPARSLARIDASLRAAGARAVLTTSKDRVKLAGRLALPLVELRVEARLEPAAWERPAGGPPPHPPPPGRRC